MTETNKIITIKARITPEQCHKLEKLRRENQTVSEWIREKIDKAQVKPARRG